MTVIEINPDDSGFVDLISPADSNYIIYRVGGPQEALRRLTAGSPVGEEKLFVGSQEAVPFFGNIVQSGYRFPKGRAVFSFRSAAPGTSKIIAWFFQ